MKTAKPKTKATPAADEPGDRGPHVYAIVEKARACGKTYSNIPVDVGSAEGFDRSMLPEDARYWCVEGERKWREV